jgi:hypothetical protein
MLLETAKAAQIDPADIRAKLTARLAEWRNLLRKETLWSRQIITKLLDGKITLTPTRDESGKPAYEMPAKLSLGGFFSGILCRSGVASPTGVVPEWSREIPGEIPAVGGTEHAA